jgi:hypothetical protein
MRGPGHALVREVLIEWPSKDEPNAKEAVVLTFSTHIRPFDPETPDLCDDCLAHVLCVVASMLDTDGAVPAPPTSPEVQS